MSNQSVFLEFKWTTSRARDSYGYNVCTLFADGRKVGRCNGGGYDMKGTCLGSYIDTFFADRLRALKPEDMPTQSHWEPEEKPSRHCENEDCSHEYRKLLDAKILRGNVNPTCYVIGPGLVDRYSDNEAESKCPHCGEQTQYAYSEGKTVDDGRYFYGLTFHDPDFNPGKAIIGTDCHDRTMSKDDETGKTVEQAETEGKSMGLERYQAVYRASSKHASPTHRIPRIDGACGFSSVERIVKAIGLSLEYMATRSHIYRLVDLHDKEQP